MDFKVGERVIATKGPWAGDVFEVVSSSDRDYCGSFYAKRLSTKHPGPIRRIGLECRCTAGNYVRAPEPEPETSLTKDIPAPEKPADWRMHYDNSSARRKDQPVTEGFLQYFPAAVRLAAELSRLGNEKHNPGEPMHHARAKSSDHINCVGRHIMDADTLDEFGLIEAIAAFWRLGAYIQETCEKRYGWPKAPRAKGDAP